MDIGLFKNQKTIAINFQQVPLRFQIILTCFKNAKGKNVDFRKNTAESEFYVYGMEN
jgi:hypothetical protein